MAGSLAEENTSSANAIYFIIKRLQCNLLLPKKKLFHHMTLKIGKVELMHVHKMTM